MPIAMDFAQFKIGVLLKDINLEADLRGRLLSKGFQTFLFHQNAMEANAVILDVEALSEPLTDFVEKALQANSEMKLIILCPPDHADVIKEYREYNTYEMIFTTEQHVMDRLVWATENACAELYFYYQNIELAQQYKKVRGDYEKALKTADHIKVPAGLNAAGNEVLNKNAQRDLKHLSLIRELCQIADFNETANYFLTQAPNQKRIYFAINAQQRVFHCTYAAGFSLDQVKDLHYKSNESELRNLLGLKFTILSDSFEKFILNLMGSPHFKIYPVAFLNDLVGFFIFTQAEDSVEKENETYYTELIWPVVSIQLEALWSRIRIYNLEIRDDKTHFYNAKFYHSKLKEEFQRAQRMQHALSLVKFQFDDFSAMKNQLGDSLQLKLNLISEVIGETGRSHDYACRLGENHFALILPHCVRKYAAVRAERLRKSLESHPEIKDQLKISMSFGVSEFPNLCAQVEDLDHSAQKALDYIAGKGGSKVCIYRAPQDFTPPFEVSAEP